jgi:cysteinyl-tRNA synthetase
MIRLYNTVSRRKETFRPLRRGTVGVYTCGPTLHARAQLGLIRRLLAVDLLKRVLRHEGYEVRHVVNLTDIDDKTIDASAKAGTTLDDLTGRFATAFFDDMKALGMWPADEYPRATGHVDDMVALTRRLVDAGLAYERQRSVYFDISAFPAYGRLSRVDTAKVRTGATVDLDYYEKDEARDFTLMRRSDLAELRRRITYRTEWGNVRPGWHIECAAMASRYLGVPFDIHTSGQDLVFPHNENENAICESLWGEPLARYWMHAGLMLRDTRKMSRSTGTAVTMADLTERGYQGRQVRYCLLTGHYRRAFAFSFERLDEACRELERLDALVRNLAAVKRKGHAHREVDEAVAAADRVFFDSLRDDLNLPAARAALFDLVRMVNPRVATAGTLTRADAELVLDFLWRADRVLAVIDFADAARPDERVDALVAERNAARAAGDWDRADAMRRELEGMGLVVEDTPDGTRVRRR